MSASSSCNTGNGSWTSAGMGGGKAGPQQNQQQQQGHELEDQQWEQAMNAEVGSAARFLTDLLVKASFGQATAEQFRRCLEPLLYSRYAGHWFPESPIKGSGYRCLRINGMMDPVVYAAAQKSGLPSMALRRAFPQELTIWVDPGEVSYRIGEEGSICVLFEAPSHPKPHHTHLGHHTHPAHLGHGGAKKKHGATPRPAPSRRQLFRRHGAPENEHHCKDNVDRLLDTSLPWITTLGSA